MPRLTRCLNSSQYGSLRVAGQRKRRSLDDLILTTPADGIVTGIACVNLDLFNGNRELTRAMAAPYLSLSLCLSLGRCLFFDAQSAVAVHWTMVWGGHCVKWT